MDESSVTLIVKASNQQFDDQSIKCERNWTIKMLKEHLSVVYPCKPSVTEQKLIYSGQLLQDNVIIKDVLRSYEDAEQPQVHIVHLVYATKSRPPPPTAQRASTSTDGLRQRIVPNASVQPTDPSSIPSAPSSSSANCPPNHPHAAGYYGAPFGYAGQPTNEYLLVQQQAMQAWMQQVYFQYINQYANFANTQSPQPSYLPPNIPAFGNWPMAGPHGQPSAVLPNTNIAAGVQHPQGVPVIPPPQAGPADVAGPEPQAPQPRFPNIVQEEQENQDWLDTFYALSRLVMLMMLVYVYSSPERCAIVLVVGLIYYLYHNGILQFNNHNAANNNNRANVANRQHRAPAAQPQPQPEPQAGEAAEQPNAAETTPVPEADNHGASAIGLFKTILLSFFTSLLPDPPAL